MGSFDLNGFFHLRRFEFHNGLGYSNLRRKCNRDSGLGIGDWGLGQGFGPTNPESPVPNPKVNVAA